MSDWIADENEMKSKSRFDVDPFALDDALVDQLLDATADDSAPVSYRRLVDVLAAARGPATEAELAGEREAVAMFRSHRPTGASTGVRRRRGAKGIFGAGILTVVTVTGAAAATGNLPDPAQDVVAAMLSKFGISLPAATRQGPSDPVELSPSGDGSAVPSILTGPTGSTAAGAGNTRSSPATDEWTTGQRTAATVSATRLERLDESGVASLAAASDEPTSPASLSGAVPAGPQPATRAGRPRGIRAGRPRVIRAGRLTTIRAGRLTTIRAGRLRTIRAGRRQVLRVGHRRVLRVGHRRVLRVGRRQVLRVGRRRALRVGRRRALRVGRRRSARVGHLRTIPGDRRPTLVGLLRTIPGDRRPTLVGHRRTIRVGHLRTILLGRRRPIREVLPRRSSSRHQSG